MTIECVGIVGWLKLSTHVEIRFRFIGHGVVQQENRRAPVGTLQTPHEEARQIFKFKQSKVKANAQGESYTARIEAPPLAPDKTVRSHVNIGRSAARAPTRRF